VPGDVPTLGACWVWLVMVLGWAVYQFVTGQRANLRNRETWITAAVVLAGISLIHLLPTFPRSLPVFGYGMMVLLGFVCALWFGISRAKAVGISPEIIMDSAFWILISGVLGGRLAFLIQYRQHVFAPGQTFGQMLFNAVNLSEGGLVLIGALVGGGIGLFGYFWVKKQNVLEFADLLMPAVFIGVGFGRIGCLLNGCCYGDRCELPWGIQFPAGSSTFYRLVEQGFLSPTAAATFPLHPTQIYSSIDGFLLALVTAIYYWYRKHPGDVLALGCILYSITRFLIEYLRADEMGQLGTGLTISQLYSVGIMSLGILLLITASRRGPARIPRPQPVADPASGRTG